MAVLRNVRILDVESPSSDAAPVDVEFEAAITAIRPAEEPDPSSAATVLPGLIDTHVHLKSRDALLTAVQSGLTTLIDLGTHPDSVVDGYRADADIPAILSAGSAASAPGSTQIRVMGFPFESGVTGPGDAERFLDWRTDNGVDLVKIIIEDPDATETPALDIPTLQAIVDGARRRGLLTVAHAVTAASFDRGLEAGVDVLTHIPFDRPLPEATVARIAETGTIVSPTLVMMRAIAESRLGEHADAAMELAIGNVSALLDGGVRVIAGTDANETPFAPVLHGPSLHSELDCLVQAGMTGAEAICAATSAAADAFGLGDRGRVVEGARADLIVIDGDPLTDLSVLSSPAEVIVGGRRLV